MNLYDPSVDTSYSYEVVEKIADLIAADATILTAVDAADVYRHEKPAETADAFVVVAERSTLGGRFQSITGTDVVPVHVTAEIRATRPNTRLFLAAMHRYIWKAIVDQRPALSYGTMALGISRNLRPTPASYDETTDTYWSMAEYYAPILPA